MENGDLKMAFPWQRIRHQATTMSAVILVGAVETDDFPRAIGLVEVSAMAIPPFFIFFIFGASSMVPTM